MLAAGRHTRRPVFCGIAAFLVLWLTALLIAPTARAADPTTTPFTRTGKPTSTVPVAPEGDFFVHGNDHQLWIASTISIATGPGTTTDSTRIISRTTANSFDAVTTLANRFIPVADWNDRLVLLTPDGLAYRIAYPGGSAAGISPPTGLKFATLAVADNTLFAIFRDGAKLLPARLTGVNWQLGKPFYDTPGLNAVAAQATASGDLLIAIAGGSASVACYTCDKSLTIEPLTPFIAPEGISEIRVLRVAGETGVWASPGKSSGGTLWKYTQKTFIPWIDLGPIPGELATGFGRIRFIFTDPAKPNDGDFERCFDEQGHPLGTAQLALPLLDENASRIQNLLSLLAMIALGVAVVSVLRQGNAGELEIRLAAYERLDLASRGKRLLAGIIDHSPCIAVVFYFALTVSITGPTLEDIANNSMFVLFSPKFVVFYALSIAIVITHTLMFELIAGRTLGKMLTGLTVVNLEGGRPSPLAIVVRNFLRIVDLVLVFSWLAVLLNPLRQTVGDSTARTVVVERRIFKNPANAPATPPPTDKAQS